MNKPRLSPTKVLAIIATVILLAVAVISNWSQMVKAFGIIFQKDGISWWLLFIIIPTQLLNSFVRGNINYLYLFAKGEKVSRTRMTRIAIETNFVDHIAILSGVAGMAFYVWRLSSNKIKASNAVCAQTLNYLLVFVSTTLLLIASVIYLIASNGNQMVIIAGIVLATLITMLLITVVFIIKNHKESQRMSVWLAKIINVIASIVTVSKKKKIIESTVLQSFFDGINENFVEISINKKALIKPFCWSLLASVMDASLIYITFASLGIFLNPVILFVASSVSSNACIFSPIPGGIGAYEWWMILLLSTAGLSSELSIAGILLARTLLFIVYIAFGLPFLLMTIRKYGKPPSKEKN